MDYDLDQKGYIRIKGHKKDGNRSNIKYCRTYEIYFKTGQQKDAPSPGQVSYNTVL
jgi:hypothetical protein